MPKTKKEIAQKAPTKKSQVEEMLREGGVSVAAIAEKLSISRQAAYSLIGDVKRSGVAISGTMRDGAMHYSVAEAKKPKAKAARTFGKGASVSAAPEAK
ncbi:HTH domain-containing protein [Mesorhizobium sp. M1A.F.Ca.IN.020.03.2.1]|uniref:HTH domain-containing protein n=1 Tax=Mesorhizobium sp. M1A.F.Ca.IN.020.03.2.1 TaxID=2496769 RepID=UPI000FD4BA75|nr:HTH domain-containing protein [Mesorhizobium sp. M1A.F.Ca.IN.020.03.2.1]RUV08161.1 HTH domain-containing protein [Mesorhizobium sp. M1A.F.Ca.IN.020.03.2.1]